MKKSIIILFIAIVLLFGAGCSEPSEPQTYEVFSIERYEKSNTNSFGKITSVDICYHFMYMDNGDLIIVDDFIPNRYSTENLKISETDKNYLVIQGQYKTLYLTKETLNCL